MYLEVGVAALDTKVAVLTHCNCMFTAHCTLMREQCRALQVDTPGTQGFKSVTC